MEWLCILCFHDNRQSAHVHSSHWLRERRCGSMMWHHLLPPSLLISSPLPTRSPCNRELVLLPTSRWLPRTAARRSSSDAFSLVDSPINAPTQQPPPLSKPKRLPCHAPCRCVLPPSAPLANILVWWDPIVPSFGGRPWEGCRCSSKCVASLPHSTLQQADHNIVSSSSPIVLGHIPVLSTSSSTIDPQIYEAFPCTSLILAIHWVGWDLCLWVPCMSYLKRESTTVLCVKSRRTFDLLASPL
jgi:hypothetical protein